MAPSFPRAPLNASVERRNEYNRRSAPYYHPMQQAQHLPMQQAQHLPMQQNQNQHNAHRMNWYNFYSPAPQGYPNRFPPERYLPPYQYPGRNALELQRRQQLRQVHASSSHMHRMNYPLEFAQGYRRREFPPNSRFQRKRSSRSRQNSRPNLEAKHNSLVRPELVFPIASSSRAIQNSRRRQGKTALGARLTEKQRHRLPTQSRSSSRSALDSRLTKNGTVEQGPGPSKQLGSIAGSASGSRSTKRNTTKRRPGSPIRTGPSSRSAPTCTSTPRAKSDKSCGRKIQISPSTKRRSNLFGPSPSTESKSSKIAPETVPTSDSVKPTDSITVPAAGSDVESRSKSADLHKDTEGTRSPEKSAETQKIGLATEDTRTPEKSAAIPEAESAVHNKSKFPAPHGTKSDPNSANSIESVSTGGYFRIIEVSPEENETVEFTKKFETSSVSNSKNGSTQNSSVPLETISSASYPNSPESSQDDSHSEIIVVPAAQRPLFMRNGVVPEAGMEFPVRNRRLPQYAHVIFYLPDEIDQMEDPEPGMIPEGIYVRDNLGFEEEQDPIRRRTLPIISRIRKLREYIRPEQLKNTWFTSIRHSRPNSDTNFRSPAPLHNQLWPRPASENCEYVFIGPNGTMVPTRLYASIPWKFSAAATKVLIEFLFDDLNLVIRYLVGEHSLDSGTINDIIDHVAYRSAVRKTDVKAAIAKLCAEKTLTYYNSH